MHEKSDEKKVVGSTMRLLYLVPEFPSQTHAFFWREVLGLRALGVNVFLVSTRRPPVGACRHAFSKAAADQTHYLFPPEWVADSFYLFRHPVAAFRAVAYVLGLLESNFLQRLMTLPLILPAARLARLAIRLEAQHLHVHSFANSAHVAALAKILGGCAYSLTLHGDLEVYGRDHASKVKDASFVTCVTTPLKYQLMQKLGLQLSTVHLLWMGVDTSEFIPLERPARSSLEPLRMITVARLHLAKGHRYALGALKRLRDEGFNIHYTIVGDGPAADEIEMLVRSMGLSGSVTITGTRSEFEVKELLQSSHTLILPSVGLGEAAPVAVMEGMSCGLPVVCSIIGGTKDMIEDGQDGFLVQQKDEDAIFECIRLIFIDPAHGVKIGQAARAKALREFDSFNLAERMLFLIRTHHE